MPQKTLDLVLGSAVADDGTVTGIAYPSGTNQAFFTDPNDNANGEAIINGNDVYTEAAAQIGITYGASTITLTNTSGVTWAAGSTVALGLAYAAPDPATVISQATIAAIGGTLTGTVTGDLADLSSLADSPATADALRDELMAEWKVAIDLNFKELQAKYNALLAAVKAAGVVDAS